MDVWICGCVDVELWRMDVEMCRCGDGNVGVEVHRCEDVKLWRCGC